MIKNEKTIRNTSIMRRLIRTNAFATIILSILSLLGSNICFSQAWRDFEERGVKFLQSGEPKKVIEEFEKAKVILQKDSLGTRTYEELCIRLAVYLYQYKRFKDAEIQYLEAKEIKKKLVGNLSPEYAAFCIEIGIFYTETAQYNKAEFQYLEVKQLNEKIFGKSSPEFVRSCGLLGVLYVRMEEYEKAETLFIEEKNLQEKILGIYQPEYASICSLLAYNYLSMGQSEKSEKFYLEALKIQEKVLGKLSPEYILNCRSLAVLYQSWSKYDSAETFFLEDKQIEEERWGKQHYEYAYSCSNLGALYKLQGKNEKAEKLYLEALNIQEKAIGKRSSDYLASCKNLALLYRDLKQYDKAESYFLEAEQIWEGFSFRFNPDYSAFCKELGIFYGLIKQYDKAEVYLQKSKQILRLVFGSHHTDYAISCNDLACFYWGLKKTVLAQSEFQEAFSIYLQNISSVFQFTNEKEKLAFLRKLKGQEDQTYSFYFSQKLNAGLPYSMSLFNRNLILNSYQSLKKDLAFNSNITVKNKYDSWVYIKKRLAILYSTPVGERNEDVTDLETKADQVEKELVKLSSQFKKRNNLQNITYGAIQKNLKKDECAIEFIEFNYYTGKRFSDSVIYLALLLRNDVPEPILIPLFEKKQLVNFLSNTSNRVKNENIAALYGIKEEDKNDSTPRSLYNLIWKPLENNLVGISKIYFSSAGLLHRISFAALHVSLDKMLSDKYRLIQLTTTASLVDHSTQNISVSDKLLLYGGVDYSIDSSQLKKEVLKFYSGKAFSGSVTENRGGEELNKLPGSLEEILKIKNLGGRKKFSIYTNTGINTTEESIKALEGKLSPSVLHIATHGFFFPDPKDDSMEAKFAVNGKIFKQADNPFFRSGLLLAGSSNAWQGKSIEGIDDGILTAYEISNLYLSNTKLVVLSACETALGDIRRDEGVYGLQRAFKMAGVQNLVMSLWKVPDNETSEFMQEFYKNLFNRQGISDAFYNAQKVMKNKYRNEPYKWASWILVM